MTAGDSIWSRYSLALSGIQAVVIVALEAVIFRLHSIETSNIKRAFVPATVALYQFPQHNVTGAKEAEILQTTSVLSVYHVLFIVAQIFQLILLCDAMFNKNTIQIMALVAFNAAMVAYAGVQVKQASDILVWTEETNTLSNMILNIFARNPSATPYHASRPYEIAVVTLMVIFASGFAFIAYKLYKEFGWSIYKKIGADLAMRGKYRIPGYQFYGNSDMYKIYQIFIMILKFDIFFQLGFSAQFLSVIVLTYNSLSDGSNSKGPVSPSEQANFRNVLIIHLVLSVGACIVLPVLAWRGLKRECKYSMAAFISGGIGTLVYNIIKLNQVFENPVRFAGANKFLTFFLILNLLLGVVTLYLAWQCMKNFNNGLNAHIGKVSGTNIYPMESVSGPNKRWSIE
ncbi:hypothetical protein BG015_002035 [Linnemannia schmuckeri]|uniref:Uncharacterized protein n=1 Tax=Linnemannia schmuckeri TaxID=64567 RepID=A0A9P5S3L4_9FUNG|nr:hypothetical protein BG015_002035 [Linnemannia schmuckeri]